MTNNRSLIVLAGAITVLAAVAVSITVAIPVGRDVPGSSQEGVAVVDPPHRGLQTPWWEQIRIDDIETRPDPSLIDRSLPSEAPPSPTALGNSEDELAGQEAPPEDDTAALPPVTIEVPADVYFATDSAELTTAGQSELAELAPTLVDAIDILVAGTTDPRGSNEHNERLAHDRALAVIEVLVESQIQRDRLRPEAWGDTRLTTRRPGQDEAEWLAENRRVVIIATIPPS